LETDIRKTPSVAVHPAQESPNRFKLPIAALRSGWHTRHDSVRGNREIHESHKRKTLSQLRVVGRTHRAVRDPASFEAEVPVLPFVYFVLPSLIIAQKKQESPRKCGRAIKAEEHSNTHKYRDALQGSEACMLE
jgi:hypothetical protein